MERTRASEGSSDRALREELEETQTALRHARASLASAGATAETARGALLASIAQAREHRDAQARRLEALGEEQARLERELAHLGKQLEAKRAEDAVLARGAALRDVHVDWYPEDTRRHARDTDGLTVQQVKYLFAGIGVFILLTTLLLWRR